MDMLKKKIVPPSRPVARRAAAPGVAPGVCFWVWPDADTPDAGVRWLWRLRLLPISACVVASYSHLVSRFRHLRLDSVPFDFMV